MIVDTLALATEEPVGGCAAALVIARAPSSSAADLPAGGALGYVPQHQCSRRSDERRRRRPACCLRLPAAQYAELLDESPHGRDAPIITGLMYTHMVAQAMYKLFWLFVCLYALPRVLDSYA